jgi:DNA-binding LytR/AlgR family response regulator
VIRIAIVEDDGRDAEALRQYIDRYAADSGAAFGRARFSDGTDIVMNYKPSYDIILPDIQRNILYGTETAERIRKSDKTVISIFVTNTAQHVLKGGHCQRTTLARFVTNMAQYALKGYAADALDFLLKPVPHFAFSQQLKRSIERLEHGRADFVAFPTEGGVAKLELARIVFIEIFKHRITAHTKGAGYGLSGTMNNWEGKLKEKGFSRCNNRCLLNLARVKAVRGNEAAVGKYALAVSRPRGKAFIAAFTERAGRGYISV